MFAMIRPTRNRVAITWLVMLLVMSCPILRHIPSQLDIFDLNQIPVYVMFLFGRLPIRFLDAITFHRFVPKSEGFLVFPGGVWQRWRVESSWPTSAARGVII